MLHQAAKILAARAPKPVDGEIWPASLPRTFDAWRDLPGVGDYTAAAVSSIAFSVPAAVVDGNVERVFCRFFDLREAPNTPRLKRAFTRIANELLAREAPGDFNQALMELGQVVCTPTNPDCASCPVAAFCLAKTRGSQALAPAAKAKAATVDIALKLVIVRNAVGDVALVERPRSAKFLKGTWGFPTWVMQEHESYVRDGEARDGYVEPVGPTIGKVRHTITRHKIKADVITSNTAPLAGASAAGMIRWLNAADVERHLLSILDRKAWALAQKKKPSVEAEGFRKT